MGAEAREAGRERMGRQEDEGGQEAGGAKWIWRLSERDALTGAGGVDVIGVRGSGRWWKLESDRCG
jgi:hypothetical protein